jgi:DNA recombination protein RmuC
MLPVLIALQILTLIALLFVLRRRAASTPESTDPRLAQLLVADLPTQIARIDARSETLDKHMRDQTAELRAETAAANTVLRSEIVTNLTTLGTTLRSSLETARQENEAAAERLRSRVQEGLEKLNADNSTKLEQMRVTVDEKLHATLQTRLTESFGAVTDQLTKVHAGLGEMTKLSSGVDDLSRIFTNVRSRGQFAEAMLDNLLKQMLAPSQFVRNAQVRPNTQEVVEFAIRVPGLNGEVLLPIDSKFPRESADRLESAYEAGSASEIAAARKVFETAVRNEAKRISSKYINEPVTTPNAIMFLPTEGLYAEVMRSDGLNDDIQQNCHVMIAGPSNLSAILTSFQMVFALVNLQKKGDVVWRVLASARSEFAKFGGLMDKMDKQVGTVQNTIRDLGVRTRAIHKTLKDVSSDEADLALATGEAGFDGFLPGLAANEEQEEDSPTPTERPQ